MVFATMCCNGRLINTNMVISKNTRPKPMAYCVTGTENLRDGLVPARTATNYITMGNSPTLYNSSPSVVG